MGVAGTRGEWTPGSCRGARANSRSGPRRAPGPAPAAGQGPPGLLIFAPRHAIAQRQPPIVRAPLPRDRLRPAVGTELDARPLGRTGERPHAPVDVDVVVAIEPVVLEAACEVAPRRRIDAHHAERVERLPAGERALVL